MQHDIAFDTLRGIGFHQALAGQLAQCIPARPDTARLARIVEAQRDWFTLHDGSDEFAARAHATLLKLLELQGLALTIGDWVFVETRDHDEQWIAGLVPPLTQIARRANDGRRQPLASNVDTALLAMGLDADYNPRRLERYLALVQASGVQPVVVLTKADLAPDAPQRAESLRLRLPASVPLFAVNGLDAATRELLAPWLGAGQTLVLLGSSGTGKSTLTNTLADAGQLTGGVRRGDGRGRHTTTARSMHRCAGGACIIDTPGLRTWRPDADATTLASTFDDIEALASQCRFRDCRHRGEPGCAVRAGIDGDRLFNFHKLLRDAERGELSPLERQARRSRWKALGKAGSARAREKRQ